MLYSVGDRIVHPGIGAGTIVDTREQELVEGFEHYFVIEIPTRESTLFIPKRKMEEVGVRPVMSRDRLAQVFETLAGEPQILPQSYKKRQSEIEDKIATGEPLQIAEAIRDLAWREYDSYLTKKDAQLLDKGRKFLTGEVAMVTGAELDSVSEIIDEALAIAIPEASEQEDLAAEAAESDQAGAEQRKQSILVAFKDRVIRVLLEAS
ncbi:MAG: hypothetical protein JXA37_13590 [Chloroflexia bacterium]|nr:hypothetical protein [Chloroflexia bacterium]